MIRWQRVPVLDEYAEEGEGVVLFDDGRVLALSPVAWTLVQALSDGALEADGLVRRLVEAHGTPTDDTGRELASELTSDLLHELENSGVVLGDAGPK